MKMRFLRIVTSCALLTAVFLAGCATMPNVRYQPGAAHPIRTIHIPPEIAVPEQMVFYGFTQSVLVGLGAMGGAVGEAVLASTTLGRKPPPDLGVADSLRNAFASELRAGGRFTVVENGPADAELKMTVKEYGFFQAGVMRRGVKPILNVRAQLVRRDGKIVWDQSRVVNQTSKSTHAQLPERMKRDPDLAVQELRTAARLVVANLARSLQQ